MTNTKVYLLLHFLSIPREKKRMKIESTKKKHVMGRKSAETDLGFSSTFYLLVLTCLCSLLCIWAPTFCLSSHCPGQCSPASLPRHVSEPTFKPELSPYLRLMLEGRYIRFRWFHTFTKDLGPFFLLVIFSYHSHTPVTGWPTTNALARVTQRSASRFCRFSISYFFLLFSLSSSPVILFITSTYQITIHC